MVTESTSVFGSHHEQQSAEFLAAQAADAEERAARTRKARGARLALRQVSAEYRAATAEHEKWSSRVWERAFYRFVKTSSDAFASTVGAAHAPAPAEFTALGDGNGSDCVGKGGGEGMVSSRLSNAHSCHGEDSRTVAPRKGLGG